MRKNYISFKYIFERKGCGQIAMSRECETLWLGSVYI